MLKLKKIQILGFKSFCDRTELTLPGQGMAAVVGPNGCGKSNILDAVSWVLGEQSARTLRGTKMEDVIFAGTRERKALGMAEVSLTLIDPDAYGDGPLATELERDEVALDGGDGIVATNGDWNEDAHREARSRETEEIIAEAQPGTVIEGEEQDVAPSAESEFASQNGGVAVAAQNAVVLKIRRRKFQRTPARAGEIIITRRLFRSGDSEYLLNGKLCRLRDIQDIFMGTGLGPESYAIIEQERIGQLLSSKPHDRRAIIEEAAGITRFKTKKRLAELRLESAKQNLARVNDIFEEVTRQMNSLKRQAAKAERYAAVRDELRTRLRVVLASRLHQMDATSVSLHDQIASLTTRIDASAAHVEALDAEHAAAVARGYELDASAKEASGRASQAAIDLERASARQHANEERIADLVSRSAAGTAELDQARQQMEGLTAEREQHRSFLETAAAEAARFRQQAEALQQQAREAAQTVAHAEQRLEAERRRGLQLLNEAANARNQASQAEEALGALEREAERLAGEMDAARRDLENLGAERGQASLQFESVTETLARLEQEILALRSEIEQTRSEETETRRRGDALRAEHATLTGRRNSLEGLIREHSYSTDTVRKLFRANGDHHSSLSAVGTLADFLEVDGQYETVVDEYLRDELNYIVVKSWDAADEGMRLLKSDVDGRATFLVHPHDAQAKFSFDPTEPTGTQTSREGIVRLKDCIRVLDGFGTSLEAVLPKLREGYVAPDAGTARSLALENPRAFFLAPSGECFHNVTVTGGKPRAEGPLAIKRELRDTQQKLDALTIELGQAETHAAALGRTLAEKTRLLEAKNEDRRSAERDSANQGAALRQMESEAKRLERRLQDWQLDSERNRNQRDQRTTLMQQKREDVARLEAEHATAEAQQRELESALASHRETREMAQQASSQAVAELAGLEERKRGAEASFARIDRMYADLGRRVVQLEQQLAAAAAEQTQRTEENASLATTRQQLAELREQALAETARWTEEARLLRITLLESEQQLKALRAETDALRESRSSHAAQAAKLAADLEHLEAACVSDLGVEAGELRAQEDIARLEDDALATEDEACRGLKSRLEAMGPVNMMALDEYKEAAERHSFLETQRTDLLDSIENTQATIREIDTISRTKFDEAFARINENFSVTFTRLFNGGQAFMRLTDEENTAESGIDIVASPPGKKLQNVLLLSGGEKALTALSLLVGIFVYQPSPFCVLDEVDAPLDETNVGRLADMLKSMAKETQFVLVTHSKRMMTAMDLIYGVTMQEPGVSKLVSVHMGGHHHAHGHRATA
ncbi:MAG: chromosome segregation protein SMC [Acidobacteriaceae bacterium]